MDINIIASNILNPQILFYFLGVAAVALKSDLDIPQPLPKFFSLYLLLSIGFKGGVELSKSPFNDSILFTLLAAILMAVLVPIYSFFILRTKFDVSNSAAIAATYGSISAVTFITASVFLQRLGVEFSGYLIAAMALMESPSIIIGLILYRLFTSGKSMEEFSWSELIREAFFNGSVFLILGSLIIGSLTGASGGESLKPFIDDIFKGMLAFFLLDMGIVSAKRIKDLKNAGGFLIAFAILVPLLNAALGIGLSALLNLSEGDAFMFTVLCASASYIAVPAAMRLSIPDANPSLYVPMSLALTFPFNIIVGLPLYQSIINLLWS